MKAFFEAAGEIREVDLLSAFVSVWREATSGSLRFSRGTASCGFDLADGDVVAVHSSEARFETSAILVRAGKLDAAALERLSVAPGADQALAAVAAGILTRREWKWGEKIRTIEILADLLSWPDGKYLFDERARPERGEFVVTVPRLLLELFLRSRDRNLIDHQLGATDLALVRSERFDEEFATFGLTADAESVVRLIDDRATAAEISARAPAEEFAVLKLLAALKTLGLLRSESVPRRAQPVGGPEETETPSFRQPAPPMESWTATQAPPNAGEPEFEHEQAPDLAEMPLEESSGGEPAGTGGETEWAPDIAALERPETGAASERSSPPWQEGPTPGEWEPEREPLDRPFDAREPVPVIPTSRHRWGLILGGLILLLVAAVVGTVLLRARFGASAPDMVALRRTTVRPTAAPPVARTSMPIALPTAAITPTAASAPTAVSRPTTPKRPTTPIPTARPTPARATSPVRPSPPEPARADWLERARRDARRLASEKKVRYAVQLELACEVPSLAEAWRHDRPAGSMWLLTTRHGGRECFRVLWGRYPSLDEARRAKGGVPPYFVTASNHPAIVSVR